MERLLGKLQSYTDLLIHMVETCLKNLFKEGVCKRGEIFTYTQINTCLHFIVRKHNRKKIMQSWTIFKQLTCILWCIYFFSDRTYQFLLCCSKAYSVSRPLHALAMVLKIISMTELETPGQQTGPCETHHHWIFLWKTKKVLFWMKENQKDAVQWS